MNVHFVIVDCPPADPARSTVTEVQPWNLHGPSLVPVVLFRLSAFVFVPAYVADIPHAVEQREFY